MPSLGNILARQAYRAVLVSDVDFIDDAIATAAQLVIGVILELVVYPFRFFEVLGGGICVFSAVNNSESAKFRDKER